MIELTGARFIAVLDASALFSIRVTNLALEAAKRGLFQVRWSSLIHEEWTRSVLKVNPDADAAAIQRRRDLMDEAFPDAKIAPRQIHVHSSQMFRTLRPRWLDQPHPPIATERIEAKFCFPNWSNQFRIRCD